MKALLDTHTVLWGMTQPSLLSSSVRTILLDEATEVLISSVVPWELSIKHHSGKLQEAAALLSDFSAVMDALVAKALPVSIRHAILAGDWQWEHRDLFDRMLAAQAATEGAILVSRDQVFDTLPGLRRFW